MKERVTDDAKADLRPIKAFISERSNSAAEGVMDRIGKTLTLIAVLPRLGHPGVAIGTFEKSVPRLPYLIVYRIDMTDDERQLVVLRAYHSAQDRE